MLLFNHFRKAALILLFAASLAAAFPAPARAAEKLGNSLDFVPADAAFYASSMRMKEQLEILLSSKAWARLMELPAAKMGLGMLRAEIEKPGGAKKQWDDFSKNPDNARLVELSKDLISNEMFIYGDEQFADFVGLMFEALNSVQYAPAFYRLSDPSGALDEQQVRVMAMLETFNDNLDRLAVPDVVIGFKITDKARADLQIRRLETLINVVIQLLSINEYKDRFGRVPLGDGEFIELRLDGKLVPWEEFPFDDFAEEPGDYEELKQKLRSLSMTIDLGIVGDYVVFSIGDSNDHVAKFGKTDLLVNRPEMRPLRAHLSKRITSVGYTSKELMSMITGTEEDLDGLVELAEELLPAAELDEDVEERLLDDIQKLADDLKEYLPEAGAAMSFAFLTDRGYESYSYNWTENLRLDGSKALPLLEHVGGAPILAYVERTKYSPDDYELLVKWLKKGYGHFKAIGLPQLPPDQQQHFEHAMQFAEPLLERLDRATRTLLVPALADGQGAIVLDAKITSKKWHQQMPEASKPLPLPELALVFGVSDAEKLKQAFAEYKAVAQAVADQIKVWEPSAIPADYRIPDPQTRDVPQGRLYWYQIPQEIGLDEQVQPAAGLSKSVAVLSTSAKQAERILATAPLETSGSRLGPDKNAAAAFYFNFNRLIDTVEPWAEYGFLANFVERNENGDEAVKSIAEAENKPQAKFVLSQIRAGAEILKCFRGYSSVTYLEDGAMVTHGESVLEDLK